MATRPPELRLAPMMGDYMVTLLPFLTVTEDMIYKLFITPCSHRHTYISHPKGRPRVARTAGNHAKQNDEPKIHVTRNGDIYVKPEDVLKSAKFREQVKKMAGIRVTRGPSKSR